MGNENENELEDMPFSAIINGTEAVRPSPEIRITPDMFHVDCESFGPFATAVRNSGIYVSDLNATAQIYNRTSERDIQYGDVVVIVRPEYIKVRNNGELSYDEHMEMQEELRRKLLGYRFRVTNYSMSGVQIFDFISSIVIDPQGLEISSEELVEINNAGFEVGDVIRGNILAGRAYSATGKGFIGLVVPSGESGNVALLALKHEYSRTEPFTIWHIFGGSYEIESFNFMAFDKIGKINFNNPIKVDYLPPQYTDDRVCIFRNFGVFAEHFSSTLHRAMRSSREDALNLLMEEESLDKFIEFVNSSTSIRIREVK